MSGTPQTSTTSGLLSELPAVGVLLAGGDSSRMGQAKAELDLGSRPLAAWAAATLSRVAETRVQSGGAPIACLGWPRLADRRPGAGPAAGIETALIAFPGAVAVVLAIDLPFVPARLLRLAVDRVAAGALAAAPHHGGRWHPLAAAYAPGIVPAITARLDAGRAGLQDLLDEAGASAIGSDALGSMGDPERMLFNVNRPEELEQARAMVAP